MNEWKREEGSKEGRKGRREGRKEREIKKENTFDSKMWVRGKCD